MAGLPPLLLTNGVFYGTAAVELLPAWQMIQEGWGEDGAVSGASVSLVVGAQGQPVDRATYAELLRRGAIDCEVIER